MHAAFVMIIAQKGKAWDIAKKVEKIKGVKFAHPVTGPYDVIAYIESKDLSKELKGIISKVHAMDEVEMTMTAIAIH